MDHGEASQQPIIVLKVQRDCPCFIRMTGRDLQISKAHEPNYDSEEESKGDIIYEDDGNNESKLPRDGPDTMSTMLRKVQLSSDELNEDHHQIND